MTADMTASLARKLLPGARPTFRGTFAEASFQMGRSLDHILDFGERWCDSRLTPGSPEEAKYLGELDAMTTEIAEWLTHPAFESPNPDEAAYAAAGGDAKTFLSYSMLVALLFAEQRWAKLRDENIALQEELALRKSSSLNRPAANGAPQPIQTAAKISRRDRLSNEGRQTNPPANLSVRSADYVTAMFRIELVDQVRKASRRSKPLSFSDAATLSGSLLKKTREFGARWNDSPMSPDPQEDQRFLSELKTLASETAELMTNPSVAAIINGAPAEQGSRASFHTYALQSTLGLNPGQIQQLHATLERYNKESEVRGLEGTSPIWGAAFWQQQRKDLSRRAHDEIQGYLTLKQKQQFRSLYAPDFLYTPGLGLGL